MRFLTFIAALLLPLLAGMRPAMAEFEPRTVILLSDAGSQVPGIAGPPLALLGLNVENHGTGAPLPKLAGREDLRGIVVWLDDGTIADDSFVDWVRAAVQARVPVMLMGRLPDVEDRFGLFLALDLLYAFDDRAYTYDMRVVDWDETVFGYERRLDPPYPEAPLVRPLDAELAHSVLVLERRGNAADRTHVLVATLKGAFAAEGYALWQSADRRSHLWLVDPVEWFRTGLRLGTGPVPDATTIGGRRIFAPGIAPVSADDDDAAADAAVALLRTKGLRMPRIPAAESPLTVPGNGLACADRLRARLLGFGTQLAGLDEDDAVRRTSAFAPALVVCRLERDLVPPAAEAIFEGARTLPLTIQRGDLASIARGFRSVRVESLPGFAWRIHDRGALQTFRVDDTEMRVDWSASEGLLGAARSFGALYIALDPAAPVPVIVLTRAPYAPPPFPVLVEARWIVSGLKRTGDRATMAVIGDGPGDMAWSTEPGSDWELRLEPRGGGLMRYRITADAEGRIAFSLPAMAGDAGTLDLIRYYGAGGR